MYYDWMARYIPDLKRGIAQQNVKCLFHDDNNPSMSANTDVGKYYCHTCGAKGDVFNLIMKYEGVSFWQAKQMVHGKEASHAKSSVLSMAEVDEAHQNLLNKKYMQDLLESKRGWTLNTIKFFKLGLQEFQNKNHRITIPIYDEKGELKNIRRYQPFGDPENKKKFGKINGITGHNQNYIFPIDNLLHNNFVLLLAGEPDTILANQLGKVAITFTAGEGSLNRNLLPLFKDKEVYICYDTDMTGVKFTRLNGKAIHQYAKFVKIIELPFERI